MRSGHKSRFLHGAVVAAGMMSLPAAPVFAEEIDARKVFATNCSWCHSDYGKKAGKGPKLAGTAMDEKQIFDRIYNGAPGGAMPAYKKTLSKEKIEALVGYIRSLPAD